LLSSCTKPDRTDGNKTRKQRRTISKQTQELCTKKVYKKPKEMVEVSEIARGNLFSLLLVFLQITK